MTKTTTILFDAVRHNPIGMLQINGARVPVSVTCVHETPGDLTEIECHVLPAFKMQEDSSDYLPNVKPIDKAMLEYLTFDDAMTKATKQVVKTMLNSVYGSRGQYGTQIKDVIFNDPATIVFWKDGSKTVVKAEYEPFDPEKGLAMAISKKVLGNRHDYYNTFKKWLKKAPKQPEKR